MTTGVEDYSGCSSSSSSQESNSNSSRRRLSLEERVRLEERILHTVVDRRSRLVQELGQARYVGYLTLGIYRLIDLIGNRTLQSADVFLIYFRNSNCRFLLPSFISGRAVRV
jgi:hypothetical protein